MFGVTLCRILLTTENNCLIHYDRGESIDFNEPGSIIFDLLAFPGFSFGAAAQPQSGSANAGGFSFGANATPTAAVQATPAAAAPTQQPAAASSLTFGGAATKTQGFGGIGATTGFTFGTTPANTPAVSTQSQGFGFGLGES